VQTQTDAASGTLTVSFQTMGTFTVESYKHSGGVLHWNVITGADVLLDASSNVQSDGNLNLSHICVGPAATSTPTATPTETPTEQPTEQPTGQPTEQPTEQPSGSVAPTESAPPTEMPTEQPTAMPTATPTVMPSGTPTAPPSATSTPSGGVEGATGTPRLTPPSTDASATGTTRSASNDGFLLVLAGMAVLLAAVAFATQATRRRAHARIRRDR
jgi:hypothetical protein